MTVHRPNISILGDFHRPLGPNVKRTVTSSDPGATLISSVRSQVRTISRYGRTTDTAPCKHSSTHHLAGTKGKRVGKWDSHTLTPFNTRAPPHHSLISRRPPALHRGTITTRRRTTEALSSLLSSALVSFSPDFYHTGAPSLPLSSVYSYIHLSRLPPLSFHRLSTSKTTTNTLLFHQYLGSRALRPGTRESSTPNLDRISTSTRQRLAE